MDNQNGQYSRYLLYLLSRAMSKKQPEPKNSIEWRREENTELLKAFCGEGYEMAVKHNHFMIGTCDEKNYIAIPGRFLKCEQPAEGKTGFTLWQPLKGGEEMYESLEKITDEQAEVIYGYWIAGLDDKTLKIYEV